MTTSDKGQWYAPAKVKDGRGIWVHPRYANVWVCTECEIIVTWFKDSLKEKERKLTQHNERYHAGKT